jgi:hypothetical protein
VEQVTNIHLELNSFIVSGVTRTLSNQDTHSIPIDIETNIEKERKIIALLLY